MKAADLLLSARILTRPQYDRIAAVVAQTNDRAEEVIVDHDVLSEADLLKALSSVYRTHFVSTDKLSRADIPRATVQMIPRRVAETLGVFPVLFDRQRSILSVVTADPDDASMLREVKLVSGASEVKAFVSRPAAINAAIRKHHGGDTRAFDLLERSQLHYEFGAQIGQQVTADGRVTTAKTDFRGPGGELGTGQYESLPRPSPPPPPVPATAAPPAPSRAPTRMAMDLDPPPVARPAARPGPTPPALPTDPPTGPRRRSISAPPPPPGASASPSAPPVRLRAANPALVARAVRESPFDLPGPPPGTTSPRPPANVRERLPEPPPAPREPSTFDSVHAPPSEPTRQSLQNDTTIELLTVMVSLLENTRSELRGHSSQVARLLRRVAERMSLDRDETFAVVVAGHIHDIGKMGQFHLTALNVSEYEGHRVAALKAYETPLRLLEAVRFPPSVRQAVVRMYERFDGKGLPDKLVGKDIPLGARLLAVADTYADLTQNPRNPFRKVLGPAEAMDVLNKHKGTIFDPGILDLFKALVLGEDVKERLLANRYRALVIDADPEESTVLELRMVEQGFDVRTARSVEAARKFFTEGTEFDLVVCEIELPDGDGLAFLAEARKESWGREVPWVVHAQKQGRAEAQKAFDLGALDFVGKPAHADILVAKLKSRLDQRQTNKKTTKGVSGSLSEMGLPDIVQVLFHGRKTGKLNVRSAGQSGEIHFLEGNIANASLGELTGTNAFYGLLKFTEGDFALDPTFVPPKRVIEEPAEALLLEGMRRMDEGL